MKLSQILTVFFAICLAGNVSAQKIVIKVDSIKGCNPIAVKFSYTTDISGITSLLWKFGNDSTSNEDSPTTHFEQSGYYKIWLIVNGKDSVYLGITLSGCIHVPNVFSPNGDTHNDNFEINYDGVSLLNLKVFTRVGALIYKKTAMSISWDGIMDSGDKILPGVYFYTLDASGPAPIQKKGFIYVFY